MTTPNEYTLVEKPIIAYLHDELGYTYLTKEQALELRGGENHVLLREHLVAALRDINDISEADAESIYADLARRTDNEEWISLLRGNYSKKLAGAKTHRPIKLIDYATPKNNRFVVTNQFEIKGLSFRIPDLVVYVNGIPLVVIEAKSAIAKQDVYDAISDIHVYEHELPRLFQANLFNIATNGVALRYGATGSPKAFWSEWKDPWPRPASDFEHEPMRRGLWSLLEKGRLLDLLAHFVVFEKDENVTIKKMCRYQQYRAVNKIVDRVIDAQHRQGLVWHTQGSGKSLTMVFATLKLKFHRTLTSDQLENLNILVVTDRKGLDTQITRTFQNCGIPNPTHAISIEDMAAQIAGAPKGKVVLSTIFKAQGSSEEIARSEDWVILIDEAHRTQERGLGDYLRATFDKARFFGFTGTPVKTKDLNTRKYFCPHGEEYLDRYGIEDAVADGATVPIHYMSRMPLWDLDGPKLDVLFDQEFAALPDELRAILKARGITRGDLARFEPRIGLIAYDIWVHFQKNVQPDSMKAQIVAVDRKACTVYKRCLDAIIAKDLMAEGLDEGEAIERAEAMSACIYSDGGKDDLKPGNEDLRRFYLDEDAEKDAIRRFNDPSEPLSFLIVCNKLLTGFDAPIEQAMYLDSPLTQHNLLQAIARTNRLYGPQKDHGMIVDYIGVTKDLGKALSSYKKSDVKDAMGGDELLIERLEEAHAAVMAFLADAERSDDPEQDAKNGVAAIGSEDVWFKFRAAATAFLKAHAAVSSAQVRLKYRPDVKYVATVITYGRVQFEQKTEFDFKEHSEKIRGMLKEHLEVTGLETLLTLPSITDPSFWLALSKSVPERDLETAALTKSAALKKSLSEKAAQNPAEYASLSQRIEEILAQFQKRQIDAAELYRKTYDIAVDLVRKDVEFEEAGLDRETHGFYAILTKDLPPSPKTDGSQFSQKGISRLVTAFLEWRHHRCVASAAPFELGNGNESAARDVVELLEQVANAPMPESATEGLDAGAYSDLAERVVRAPNRIMVARDMHSPELGPWIGWVFLGVEPLLFKIMALVEPALAADTAKKRSGLGALVTALQKRGRIPYDLNLSSKEFEATEGWAERSAYNNAVRDVVAVRIDEAHKAPKQDRELWYSALVMMLGVVQQNETDLRAALAGDAKPTKVLERKSGDDPTEDLPEEKRKLREVSVQLRELYTDKESAPVNWHRNHAVTKSLRQLVRRLLKDVVPDRDKRKVTLDAIAQHANKHFARTRE